MHLDSLRRQWAAISAGAMLCAAFSFGCQAPVDAAHDDAVDAPTIGTTRSELFALTTALWKTPGAIPVCWEAAGFTQEKAWVADAVQKSWETATAAIHFTGWDTCTAQSRGVRIVINSYDRQGPHVVSFGQQLDGVRNGMTLDFAFSSGAFPPCTRSEAMRERCIRAISTHEFGHAIGFLHEQERADTPNSCPDKIVGVQTAETKPIGAWDLMSIMNYCYPDRENVFPTMLSPQDISGAREMYPPPAPAQTPPAKPNSTDPAPTTGGEGSGAEPAGGATSSGAEDPPAEEEETAPAKPKKPKKPSSLGTVSDGGCAAAPGSNRSAGASWLFVVAACAVCLRRRERRQARRGVFAAPRAASEASSPEIRRS